MSTGDDTDLATTTCAVLLNYNIINRSSTTAWVNRLVRNNNGDNRLLLEVFINEMQQPIRYC